MRKPLVLFLIILVIAAIVSVIFMPDEGQQPAGQPAPHALEQEE